METNKIFPFLKLPRELRDEIYKHFDHSVDSKFNLLQLHKLVPVLKINHQIRSEAADLIIREKKKNLRVHASELEELNRNVFTGTVAQFETVEIEGLYFFQGMLPFYSYGDSYIMVEGEHWDAVRLFIQLCKKFHHVKKLHIYVCPEPENRCGSMVGPVEFSALRDLEDFSLEPSGIEKTEKSMREKWEELLGEMDLEICRYVIKKNVIKNWY